MDNLSSIINTPALGQVVVEYLGTRYIATEADIRWLQLQVKLGKISRRVFTVFDRDSNGSEYCMYMRDDGLFANSFTCNIFNLTAELALAVL